MNVQSENDLIESLQIVIPVIFVSLVVGGFFSLISQVIYLFFIFPILMWVISGVLISKMIGYKKINFHHRFVVLGISAGLMITGSFHLIRYQLFRFGLGRLVEADLSAVYGYSTNKIVSQVVDQIIFSVSGSRGFWGYLVFLSNQGFSIRTISYLLLISGATEAQKTGSVSVWIYWISSFFIVTFLSIFVSRSETTKSKTKEIFLGEVNVKDTNKLINLIQQKDFLTIKEFFVEEAGIPCLLVSLQTYDNEIISGTWLVIKRILSDENGKYFKQVIFQVKITSEQAGELQ